MQGLNRLLMCAALWLAGPALASGGGGGEGGGGNYLKLEPVVVNVQGGYLNFVPQLKLADPKDLDRVKAFTPMLRHTLIKSLIGQSPATVQSTEFIAGYSHKASEMLNKALGDKYVTDVLFDRWLVQ